MSQYTCELGDAVEIDTRHLGPYAARGLAPPVRVLCLHHVDELGLEVKREGGLPFVVRDGLEYRLIGGAFVRSDADESAKLYQRADR